MKYYRMFERPPCFTEERDGRTPPLCRRGDKYAGKDGCCGRHVFVLCERASEFVEQREAWPRREGLRITSPGGRHTSRSVDAWSAVMVTHRYRVMTIFRGPPRYRCRTCKRLSSTNGRPGNRGGAEGKNKKKEKKKRVPTTTTTTDPSGRSRRHRMCRTA